MKAKEAPEKIYIVSDDLNIKQEWYKTKQVGFETTEYTRTDAFIEKALEWIRKEIRPYYSDVKYKYEDFKKYMSE